MLGRKLLSIGLSLLMTVQVVPLYGWRGDGFLLPGRGYRVGQRCANGTCIIQGPRRQAAAANYESGNYARQQYSSGGSAGSYGGYSHEHYSSGGSAGSYGSAVYSSGGSSGSYGSAQNGGFYDVYGNYWQGQAPAATDSSNRASSGSDSSVECDCDCEGCTKHRESKTSDLKKFKDALTTCVREQPGDKLRDFKSKLHLVMRDAPRDIPGEVHGSSGPLLASR